MTLKRKLTALLAALFAALTAFGLTALAAPHDDDSPLHEVMTKVQVAHSTILKGVRNPVMFKKSQEDVVKAAKELVERGKESREMTDLAKKENKVEEWHKLMDAMIKESELFAEKANAKDAEQPVIKKSYTDVQKTCTACHDVFRVDE